MYQFKGAFLVLLIIGHCCHGYEKDSTGSLAKVEVKLLSEYENLNKLTNYTSIAKFHATNQQAEVALSSYTPVVMWHGMGDTAHGSPSIIAKALQRQYPGMKVFSIQIGNNAVEDELSSYFVNVNTQIEQACEAIISNQEIRDRGSFNAIGFSQGCQFLRGLIQRCPLRQHGIKAKNFISLGGQHQGVYGLPNCMKPSICDYIRFVLTNAVYERSVQEHVVQAEYWHDPWREEEYRERNIFLSDINNERQINETYRKNLASLNMFVLVQFDQDEMVIPRESSLFGFYAPNQTNIIVPLRESSLFLEDRIGLREMDLAGRLRLITIPGHHLQFTIAWFLKQAALYLDN